MVEKALPFELQYSPYQYLVGAPFALITASIRRGMEVISCGTAEVVWKPRFL